MRVAGQFRKHYGWFWQIARAPRHPLYERTYDYPLPKTLFQSLTEKGRPPAHLEGVRTNNMFLGAVPMEKASWKRFQDYYFNCISDVDRSIDTILTELDNLGMMENTIIIFMGDHGPAYHRGKLALYDFGIRVPLAISGPGIRSGVTTDQMVSAIDLMPTLLDLCGLKERTPALQHGPDG